MSRIGKQPIPIPQGVEVKIEPPLLTVKGPKGELKRRIHPKVRINQETDSLVVSVEDNLKESRALYGLFRVLVNNMVTGVSQGFERVLEIVGVGYRAEVKDRTAVFNLGYSNPVNFDLPQGIDMKVDRLKITLSGIDKEILGETAARIRQLRPPEPYKGKGIKYGNELIRRKAGKAGAK